MEQLTTRNIELDKICRICLVVKKEMRPLFGEMIAEMLMEIAKIQVSVRGNNVKQLQRCV